MEPILVEKNEMLKVKVEIVSKDKAIADEKAMVVAAEQAEVEKKAAEA